MTGRRYNAPGKSNTTKPKQTVVRWAVDHVSRSKERWIRPQMTRPRSCHPPCIQVAPKRGRWYDLNDCRDCPQKRRMRLSDYVLRGFEDSFVGQDPSQEGDPGRPRTFQHTVSLHSTNPFVDRARTPTSSDHPSVVGSNPSPVQPTTPATVRHQRLFPNTSNRSARSQTDRFTPFTSATKHSQKKKKKAKGKGTPT